MTLAEIEGSKQYHVLEYEEEKDERGIFNGQITLVVIHPPLVRELFYGGTKGTLKNQIRAISTDESFGVSKLVMTAQLRFLLSFPFFISSLF